MMKNPYRSIVALVFLLHCYKDALATAPHAFLVQNSGWMEPFYVDSKSQLKPLISAVINAVTEDNTPIFIGAFSQSVDGNESPKIVYQDIGRKSVVSAIDGINLAYKPKTGGMADTDFSEAIFKIINNQFMAKSGIIWLFTNNKNSPNNSPETEQRNREFYELVHSEPSITRVLSFPLAMSVQGKQYQANGLMVYAIAYGKEAADQLDILANNGKIATVLFEPPARLKPLDQESVRIIPKSIINTSDVTVKLDKDGKTLLIFVDASTKHHGIVIGASLENLFYPYKILTAQVKATVSGVGWQAPLQVSKTQIEQLEPDSQVDVEIVLPIEQANIPSVWSLESLRAVGTKHKIRLAIDIDLVDQRLVLSNLFKDRLDQLFPGDPMPDVFTPQEAVKSSKVQIPVFLQITYPVYPLIIVLGCALFVLGGILVTARLLCKPQKFSIMVDGVPQSLILSPFSQKNVCDSNGEVVSVVKRRLIHTHIAEQMKNHSVSM